MVPHEKESRKRNANETHFPEGSRKFGPEEKHSPRNRQFSGYVFSVFFYNFKRVFDPEWGPNKSRKQIKTFPEDSRKFPGSFPEGKLLLRQRGDGLVRSFVGRDGTRPLPRLVFVETGRGAAAPGLPGASRSENTYVMLLAGCLWLDGGDGLVRRKGVGAEGGKGG